MKEKENGTRLRQGYGGQARGAMKRIVLNRNGQISAMKRETSDLKAGRFHLGEHVMLSVKDGDCGYRSKCVCEYVVVDVKPCNRFGGGRETVTFERVEAKENGTGGTSGTGGTDSTQSRRGAEEGE